jgi:hypothetical protein
MHYKGLSMDIPGTTDRKVGLRIMDLKRPE